MIRSFTCVCALLAGASGLYLYSEKHRTTLLDQKISRIVSDTQQIRERTAMLRAEWALLNQPDRLQGLATRFLPQLGSMAPTQFVQLASLDARLPAAGPETPPHPIVTPETAPSLVGAKPAGPAGPAVGPAPDAEGAAIADAAPDGAPGSATRLAQGSTAKATRLAQAARTAVPAHDVQVAESGDGQNLPARDQAALRRVSTHGGAHAVHAAPVRLAGATAQARFASATAQARFASATAPAVRQDSSGYGRAAVIPAAAWRPARAAWPAPRAVSYSVPAPQAGSSLGSSLGGGHSSLPAPVPVSDGN